MDVLLVEDDPEVIHVVQQGLGAGEFVLSHASDLVTAEGYLQRKRFGAIVLDLTLPDGEGLDLAASLRAGGNETPILILTARDSVSDRLLGFDHGADDYLGKPFDVNELAARLRVMARRSGPAARHALAFADLELNLLTRTARRPQLEAALSDREVGLLACLMRRPREVHSREFLLGEVWGAEVEGGSNLVNVYINLLRNKIESPCHLRLIHTIRGVGYMLSEKEPDEPR